MPPDTPPRYWAFISYSHRDRRWGDWLHGALETYRLPRALVAAGAPARLFPVFRDREELAGAVDLSARIQVALAQSRNLVAICSPQSAASRWVDEELRAFARLGRADRVFALIVDGEPHAAVATQECLPPALRFKSLPDGRSGDEPADYLAADARAHADGKRNALLKLVAGLVGVDYDQLKRRDQERQMRTRAAWIGALVVLALVLATLAAFAVVQRDRAVASASAERRARDAEVRQRRLAEEQRGIAQHQQGIAEEQRTAAEEARGIAEVQRNIAQAQRRLADERERLAVSRQLATEALGRMGSQVDLALLLAVESRRPAPTVESAGSLLKILQSQAGLVKMLHGHVGAVTQLAFSPDGKTLASGGLDSSVRLWAADGQALLPGPLYVHRRSAGDETNAVRSLAFSADGTQVASGSLDGTLRFADVAQRRMLDPESRLGGTVSVLAFGPEGQALVGANALVQVDLAGDRLVGPEFAVDGRGDIAPEAGAVSPDGKLVAATKSTLPDEGLYLFDGATHQALPGRLAERYPSIQVMRFSPDGAWLVAGDRDGGLRAWDVKTRQPLGPAIGGDGIVLDLAFDMARLQVAWVRSDGSVRRADLKTWRPVETPVFVGAATSAAFSPDRATLALGSQDGAIRLWNLAPARHALGRRIAALAWLEAVAVSPDGRTAVVAGDHVAQWDLETGTIVRALEGDKVRDLAFSRDGSRLAFADERGAGWYELPAGTRIRLPTPAKEPGPRGVAISPDGRLLALAGDRLSVWDTGRRAERPVPQQGKGGAQAVAISRDGRLLAAGFADGTARTWTLADLKPTGPPLPFGEPSSSLAFSPDGTLLALGGEAGRLQLWTVATRSPLGLPLPVPKLALRTVRFSPDGTLLVAGGGRRFARLYDVATRRPLADPLFDLSEYEEIAGADFSADGRRVVLADRREQFFVLDGDVAAWTARACRVANRDLSRDERSRLLGDAKAPATCPAPAADAAAPRAALVR